MCLTLKGDVLRNMKVSKRKYNRYQIIQSGRTRNWKTSSLNNFLHLFQFSRDFNTRYNSVFRETVLKSKPDRLVLLIVKSIDVKGSISAKNTTVFSQQRGSLAGRFCCDAIIVRQHNGYPPISFKHGQDHVLLWNVPFWIIILYLTVNI